MIERKKVSKAWIWVLHIVPDAFHRWLPPWVTDNIERAVYDGLTRHEWFVEQIDMIERGAPRTNAARPK